jgi:hypothetical protein
MTLDARVPASFLPATCTLAVVGALISLVGQSAEKTSRQQLCVTPVAGTMTCTNAVPGASVVAPMPPLAPQFAVPIGPIFGGEHEDVVIRDNGGRHVARG